jgi:hypothetical protein
MEASLVLAGVIARAQRWKKRRGGLELFAAPPRPSIGLNPKPNPGSTGSGRAGPLSGAQLWLCGFPIWAVRINWGSTSARAPVPGSPKLK